MIFGQSILRIALITCAVLVVVALISLKMCSSSRQDAEQAKQEARSSDAYAGAAKEAVAVITTRSDEHEELREVVAEAAKDIANAEGSDQAIPPAVRAAALRAACRLPNYRLEPACKVFSANP